MKRTPMDERTHRGMGINEWCRLNKLPCVVCGQQFQEGDGVGTCEHEKFYHYPTCPPIPPVAPPSKSAVPPSNRDTDKGAK